MKKKKGRMKRKEKRKRNKDYKVKKRKTKEEKDERRNDTINFCCGDHIGVLRPRCHGSSIITSNHDHVVIC